VSKGDIVLIPFPFTDLTGLKNRPALILFESESSVVVAFITSQLKWQDKLDLRLDPSPENGLKKTSIIKLSKLATLDTELIIGKLGNLTASEVRKLNEQLIQLLRLHA
jgi:mRNA interferase MazF